MATDGDRHADDGDDECDQLNRTNDREPDDNMSNDDDDADRDLHDHNDKDDDDDAEQVRIGGDDPVCKSCGNFGHRSHRDHRSKVFIRTKRLYMLDEDLEIIDLTTDVGTGPNTSTTVLNAAEEAQARLRRIRCALSQRCLSTVSMHTT